MDRQNLILVTGGTGYVGGRLLQRFGTDCYAVRCMARRPKALQGRAGKNTEVVFGDCFDPGSLSSALAGVHTAYDCTFPRRWSGRDLVDGQASRAACPAPPV